ncbi:MAG TPA: trypsin-like peptidase domain-containing protein [Bryobacteraceae bacterium]|jgi:serine protease Do|nr:trypsin-like peptidase domain-containing protein [Bryobacteraceae bacterium]
MPLPVPGRIAEALRRSTVHVRSGTATAQGSGSGIILAPHRVLTNAHVLRGRRVEIEDWEGRRVHASLVMTSARRDLALLEAPALRGSPAMLGDSDLLRPGAPVLAIGNPFGFTGAISTGIVHRLAGHDWICADLQLAPGNSGGPLADFQGRVVGLNTMIAAGGLAFAISSRALQRFLSDLRLARTA